MAKDRHLPSFRCTHDEQAKCDHVLAGRKVVDDDLVDNQLSPICDLIVPYGCPKIDCRPGLVCAMNYTLTPDAKTLIFPCSKCVGSDMIELQLRGSRKAAENMANKMGTVDRE